MWKECMQILFGRGLKIMCVWPQYVNMFRVFVHFVSDAENISFSATHIQVTR